MYKKWFIIFVIVFIIIPKNSAQTNIDSLKIELSKTNNTSKKADICFKLGRVYLINKSDFEKALAFYSKAELNARLAHNDTLFLETLINKYYCFARLYSTEGIDSNTKLIQKLSTYFPQKNNRLNAKYYVLIGDEAADSDIQKGLNYYLEAKKYFILAGVKNLFAIDQRLIRIYQRSNEYRKTLSILKPFVTQFKERKLYKDLNQVYHNIAVAYYNLENDSCIFYFNESANFALSNFGDTATFLSDNVLLIDYLIINKQKFGEAEMRLANCKRIIKAFSKPLDKITISNIYGLSGDLFKNKTSLTSGDLTSTKENIKQAIDYYRLALNQLKTTEGLISERSNIQILYTSLSDCYVKINQADSALFYYKKAIAINDTITKTQNDKASKELLAKYETEKKDTEINLLNEKNKVFDSESKQNKLIILGAIIIAGLSMISLFIFINRYRIKKKANDILQVQKNIITQTNKELIKRNNLIQESIDYAAIIQQSILHNELVLSKNLNDFFVINNPKEAVGGDFYWVHTSEVTNNIYIAVADCTGHGVPGSLMTLLCNNVFNQIIDKEPDITVSNFLSIANKKIYNSFNTDKTSQKSTNGMNVLLVCINKTNNTLTYAGAKNALLITKMSNGVQELKVDLYSIGYLPEFTFTEYTTVLNKDDVLYLTTDGFADQVGGLENKKFLKLNLIKHLKAIYHLPMAQQKIELRNTFINWKGANEQKDDVCLLAVKIT